MKNSKRFTWNWNDAVKGSLVVIFTTLATTLYTAIEQQHMPTQAELLTAVKIAVFAGAGYLIKQFLTNSSGEIVAKPKDV